MHVKGLFPIYHFIEASYLEKHKTFKTYKCIRYDMTCYACSHELMSFEFIDKYAFRILNKNYIQRVPSCGLFLQYCSVPITVLENYWKYLLCL